MTRCTVIDAHLRRRRGALVRLAALSAASIAYPLLAQPRVLRIGMTLDTSGVERANGAACAAGAAACFEALNSRGGIGGAKLELKLVDDQFKPDAARANAQAFAADRSVLSLLTPLGTRQTAAVMEAVRDLPIVAPYTGTAALRRSSPPNVFWVRASYDLEVERLVRTAATLGTKRIGIVHPDDPLGKSVLAAFETSMSAAGLKPAIVATTPGTASPAVDAAARLVAEAAPQVVIMVLAGMAPAFVKALRLAGGNSTVYGLSIAASAGNIAALGGLGRGIGFAIIVPSPFAPKNEIVRRYRADLQAAKAGEPSLPSLEGYINARVLVEGLRRAGSNPTRSALTLALEGMGRHDLGGFAVSYGPGDHLGSRFVDVAVLGANGRLMA